MKKLRTGSIYLDETEHQILEERRQWFLGDKGGRNGVGGLKNRHSISGMEIQIVLQIGLTMLCMLGFIHLKH